MTQLIGNRASLGLSFRHSGINSQRKRPILRSGVRIPGRTVSLFDHPLFAMEEKERLSRLRLKAANRVALSCFKYESMATGQASEYGLYPRLAHGVECSDKQ